MEVDLRVMKHSVETKSVEAKSVDQRVIQSVEG